MTQRPSSSGDQFSASSSGSGFETVDLGSSGATSGGSYGTTGSTGNQSTTDQVQQKAGQIADQAQQKVGQAVDQAQQAAGQVAGQARSVVTNQVSSQKERAAEGLSGVAQALRQTGESLRTQQSGVVDYVDSAANQIERVAGYLRDQDVGQMVDDVERFARRQPGLFLGSAFVLGLLGARFLKSSRSASSGNYPLATRESYARTQNYGQNYGGSTYGGGSQGGTTYGRGYTAGTTGGLGTTTAGTSGLGTTSGYGAGSTGGNLGSTTGSTSGLGTTSGYGTGSTLGSTGSDTGTTGSTLGSTGSGTGTTGSTLGSTGSGTGTTGSTSSDYDATGSTRSVGGTEER